MSAQTLLVILLVGLIAGWLAGQIVQGTGFGLVADIAIGIVGALIGSWLLSRLGIHLGSGIVPAIIGATIGAIILAHSPACLQTRKVVNFAVLSRCTSPVGSLGGSHRARESNQSSVGLGSTQLSKTE